MEAVYIIVKDITTPEHGGCSHHKKLATYDAHNEKRYPAFETPEEAQTFIDNIPYSEYYDLIIMGVPIHKTL